ncbi:MAG: PadR family transcriptional regulator [Anaerolineales bacterium]|nr:PadR family transcriptional regulator [Anaerolineales bacterium]
MSLKHAILGFLSFKPLSGYDLKKAFDRSVRHFWPANQSQIYRTLAELDEQGLVDKAVIERDERLDMKIYSISDEGRTELHRWLSTPLPEQDDREPFLIQVYFSGQLKDDELLHLLQNEIRKAEENLAALVAVHQASTTQPKSVNDERAVFLSMLTLEYGLASNQALIQWLKNAITCIQAGDYSPAQLSRTFARNAKFPDFAPKSGDFGLRQAKALLSALFGEKE